MKVKSDLNILVIPAWFEKSNAQVGSFFHEYAEALSQVHMVSLLDVTYCSSSQKINNNKIDAIPNRGYSLIEFKYKSKFPIRISPLYLKTQKKKLLKRVLKLIQENQFSGKKFDIIHLLSACNNVTPIIARHLSQKLNIPIVITEHYSSFHLVKDQLFKPFTSLEEIKEITKNAEVRFAVSKAASVSFEKFFEADFKVCNNLIPDVFLPSVTPLQEKRNQGFQYLCVGRLYENKGQIRLLKAFKEAKQLNYEINLVLIGDGDQKYEIEKFILENEMSNYVSLFSSVSQKEIIDYYDQSDVLVSVSFTETFGLTIIEAMYRGLPCISTRSGGPNELINSNNGILISVDDHRELVKAILDVYQDYRRFNKKIISAEAISKYSVDVIMGNMTSEYRKIIDN